MQKIPASDNNLLIRILLPSIPFIRRQQRREEIAADIHTQRDTKRRREKISRLHLNPDRSHPGWKLGSISGTRMSLQFETLGRYSCTQESRSETQAANHTPFTCFMFSRLLFCPSVPYSSIYPSETPKAQIHKRFFPLVPLELL